MCWRKFDDAARPARLWGMPIVHLGPSHFDLCGETARRGNWYSAQPSDRFCAVVRKHTKWIERSLDRSCGEGNLALCRGASCRWASVLYGEDFDGHSVDGDFRLGTRSSGDDAPHEWLVVKKATADGKDLLFDPPAKQFWQDLRGCYDRFTRRRYITGYGDKTPFSAANCVLGDDD